MSNVEVRHSVDFIKMTERSGSIFDILRFAVYEVSYEQGLDSAELVAGRLKDSRSDRV